MKGNYAPGKSPDKSRVKSSGLSSGLGGADLGDMYSQVDGDVRNMRIEALERRLSEARKQHNRYEGALKRQVKRFGKKMPSFGRQNAQQVLPPSHVPQGAMPEGAVSAAELDRAEHLLAATGLSSAGLKNSAAGLPIRNILLMALIVGLAGLKIAFDSGVVEASKQPIVEVAAGLKEKVTSSGEEAIAAAPEEKAMIAPVRSGAWSTTDKQILTSLDARRVELEQRRQQLDQREAAIERQGQALAERLAELRTLSTKLAAMRSEKDKRYESRLEQLANVYGSMSPNEAAPLIARLDDPIALALLERMPGKRMGQILGLMDPARAIDLTKSLTKKSIL